jgi:hypothetical protein
MNFGLPLPNSICYLKFETALVLAVESALASPGSNLKSQKSIYSSVFFFFRKAALGFEAALLDFFCGFSSAAGVATAAVFDAARFALGAAAAPPRLARLLTAGFASPLFPSELACASGLSLETKIVT